ncbi:hypothetical protein B0H21DRAFT_818612 [Amylocystis lapponica]|nr:hypothetical protein B0H21DRAFT_818612 [Amylocystis lapponica]
MGRRKIEIQPITRKNGLFKKAYELGVLCSVDVAVIIFGALVVDRPVARPPWRLPCAIYISPPEERQGHHVKLYQYCSTDVHNMVTRHLRFDGEKDTRTPADFSNNKAQEVAEEEDEDGDEDDGTRQIKRAAPITKPSPQQQQPKVKVDPNGPSGSVSIRPMQTPTNDSSMTIDLDYRNARISPSNNGSSSIPVSGERHNTSAQMNGRAVQMGAKRPRLDDVHLHNMHAMPTMPVDSVANSPGYPYRLEVDMSPYISPSHVAPPAPLPHPHTMNLYPSASVLGAHSAPASFLQQFDSPHPPPQPQRALSFPHNGSPYQQQQQPQQSMYAQRSQHAHSFGMDLLGSITDHGGTHTQHAAFPTFDWPVHAQQPHNEHTTPAQDWFDFIPGPPGPGPGTALPPAHAHARPPSSSISSTRSLSFALASSSEGASPGAGHKRAREDDEFAELGMAVKVEQNGRRSASGDRAPG